jgi:broad specificity phosphatase PhoE
MHFIRHGQSHFNLEYTRTGRDPGIHDAGLTDEGFEQARRAAAQLAGKGG